MSPLVIVAIPFLPVLLLMAFLIGDFDSAIEAKEKSINEIMHGTGKGDI